MALSPDNKFIFVNTDTNPNEYDSAQIFPIKHLRGLECASAVNVYLYFRGPKDATSTRITVSITSGYMKEFFTQFVDEINFGEKVVITLVDRNIAVDPTTGGSDFVYINANVGAIILSDITLPAYGDMQVVGNLDVAGSFKLDSISLSTIQSSAEAFADNDTSLMTSAAIDDRISASGGGSDGWHGSTTRIKILASNFIADDGGRPVMIDDTGVATEDLFLESFSSNPVYATIAIPTGYKATHVMIYGTNTPVIEVWEHQINSKTGVSKGTGNVDTEINITDVTSSITNYLFIQVASASGDEIHGGYVTIATV
jgi:hypothetical protein